MRAGRTIGNVAKLAILAACFYAILNWQGAVGGDDDVTDFAKSACVSEIRGRFEVSNARVYEVHKNSSGYVVRISATLNRGTPVKVACLTNPHGGVRDISIDERG